MDRFRDHRMVQDSSSDKRDALSVFGRSPARATKTSSAGAAPRDCSKGQKTMSSSIAFFATGTTHLANGYRRGLASQSRRTTTNVTRVKTITPAPAPAAKPKNTNNRAIPPTSKPTPQTRAETAAILSPGKPPEQHHVRRPRLWPEHDRGSASASRRQHPSRGRTSPLLPGSRHRKSFRQWTGNASGGSARPTARDLI